MDGLDDKIRLALEKTIDNHLNEPNDVEKSTSLILKLQGIEPNLETILSYISGLLYGMSTGYYATNYQRAMNDTESLDFIEFMKRRAWELRQAMLGTRIEK